MTATATVSELVQNVQRLNAPDFELFFRKIQTLRTKRQTPVSQEAKLLEKINAGLPRRLAERWQFLIARRDAGTISPAEFEELMQLTETVEKLDFQRLKLITRLAQLRNVSLPEVVELYKIRPQAHG